MSLRSELRQSLRHRDSVDSEDAGFGGKQKEGVEREKKTEI